MSRRRRRQNPLLARIIWISVLAHVIILPILGYFVGFKKIEKAIMGPQVVIMPPPQIEKTPPEVHHLQKEKSKKAVAKTNGQKRVAQAKSNAPQPKVVAANVPPNDSSSDTSNTVNAAGSPGFKPGTLPTAPAARNDNPGAGTSTPPKPEPKPEPPAPKPEPPKPHVPVVTEVATTYNPSPVIPDDLRSDALNAEVIAQFMVDTNGVPGEVKIVKSSGNQELDQLALETARKWRFKPATRDGVAIQSQVILHIQFEVQ